MRSSAGPTCFWDSRRAVCSRRTWSAGWQREPLILALANPIPEILPEEARGVRDDAVIATGRSDYPNQVNNVLCFPFIFRGALDVGATTITRPMEIAAVHAIAELARHEQSDIVAAAYGGIEDLSFGPELHHSEAVRSALDRQDRAGGCQGRDGIGRRHSSDPRSGGLLPAPAAIRLSQRHVDAADLRGSAQGGARAQPDRLRRRRGRTGAARRANRGGREDLGAHPRRSSGGDRAGHQAPRPANTHRRALHGGQSGPRCALPGVLAGSITA